MKILDVKDLKISFGAEPNTFQALKGVSFSVMENEVVSLVGESGSGKTLSALAVMGILPKEARVDSGTVDVQGVRGKDITMIFQEPFTSLNPVLTIGEQIEEVYLFHTGISRKEAKEKAIEILGKVKIKDPERRYHDHPHQLSGGERQRVMIAMSIALHPKLLIADEPTTALDVTIQRDILKLLKSIKDEMGMSMIFITHDLSLVKEIADRVIVMKNGEVVETGTKDQILNAPKAPYTKRLIDALPRMDDNRDSHTKSGDVLIEVKGVKKSYAVERGFLKGEAGRTFAVDGVSMKIQKGMTLGLLGESGSGKSTLGRLILGLDRPDEGEILVNGAHFTKKYPLEVRKMMQIVFQDPYSSLDPRMKMKDIVLEGITLLGDRGIDTDAILKDVLAKVQIPYDDRFKYPHQFSGGQRQRIAIARALAVKPEFLVLDEPVSSLDVIIQKDILDLLVTLKKDMGLTYLFISHDLRVVRRLADHVFVMQGGKVVEDGSVNDIYESPKTAYTKVLIQSILG